MSPPAKWLVRVASWFLGMVFICAGALKMADPLAFADSVASFQLLPGMMISAVALVLPVLEMLLGLSLLIGVRRRACAVAMGFLCVVFAVALTQALVRGLTVDCGCFGRGEASTYGNVRTLARALGLALLAGWVSRRSR